mmetsp:Transcript_4418/g.7097  ORF Transcript_4418/g.7097 Transcript_4418/m.7097 type:complete len:89 (-) Transcript_4418:1142-1408(-)
MYGLPLTAAPACNSWQMKQKVSLMIVSWLRSKVHNTSCKKLRLQEPRGTASATAAVPGPALTGKCQLPEFPLHQQKKIEGVGRWQGCA